MNGASPVQWLQRVMDSQGDNLTAADRRICDIVLRDPTGSAFLSAQALAARAEMHQASVVRFAQKLGFSGFTEFREALRVEVRDSASAASRLQALVADEESILDAFVGRQMEAIAAIGDHVPDSTLTAAAGAIARARRVFVFASGHATALAELALRRLARIGVTAVDLRGSRRDMAERLAGLGKDDAVLAFAFRRLPGDLPPILETARDAGAVTVAISDVLASALRPRPEHVLAAPRGQSGRYHTLLVPLALTEALAIAVARLAPDRATNALDEIGRIAARFDTESPNR